MQRSCLDCGIRVSSRGMSAALLICSCTKVFTLTSVILFLYSRIFAYFHLRINLIPMKSPHYTVRWPKVAIHVRVRVHVHVRVCLHVHTIEATWY